MLDVDDSIIVDIDLDLWCCFFEFFCLILVTRYIEDDLMIFNEIVTMMPAEIDYKERWFYEEWIKILYLEMRIVDESDDIVPWISHSRDHDVFSDIHGLLDFPGSTFEKIIIRFFYIVYSPKCHDIFSFHCFFSLQSEFISTDIVADIVGLIEMWKCLECLAVPCFRFSEIIHFI